MILPLVRLVWTNRASKPAFLIKVVTSVQSHWSVDIPCSVTTLKLEVIYKDVSTFQQRELPDPLAHLVDSVPEIDELPK